jgi:hypothetical protein
LVRDGKLRQAKKTPRAYVLAAKAVGLQYGLPVLALCRHWQVIDGEPTGPNWELTFRRKADSC